MYQQAKAPSSIGRGRGVSMLPKNIFLKTVKHYNVIFILATKLRTKDREKVLINSRDFIVIFNILIRDHNMLINTFPGKQ